MPRTAHGALINLRVALRAFPVTARADSKAIRAFLLHTHGALPEFIRQDGEFLHFILDECGECSGVIASDYLGGASRRINGRVASHT
jgi:hypothetical protein